MLSWKAMKLSISVMENNSPENADGSYNVQMLMQTRFKLIKINWLLSVLLLR